MHASNELRVITGVLVGLLLLPNAVTSDPVAAAPPVAEGDASSDTAGDPAEILVKYRPSGAGDAVADFESGPRRQRRAQLNRQVGAVAIGEVSESLVEVVRLDQGVVTDDALRRYQDDPSVEIAEPNYRYATQETADDTYFGQQWALSNHGQAGGRRDADIDAPEAWNLTTGRRTVVVVVIDTGIDYNHPDLADNVWTNPREIPDDGIDNDHNGYTDDVHGYDVVDGDGDPADLNGHGTHVAGIIGATGDNGIGIAGVSWNVKIAACRFLDASGGGDTASAIGCLDYVKALRRAGVNVVATNNSWSGGDESELLRQAISAQQDVLFIAAAGNDQADLGEIPAYPASYALPNVISVAATDRADQLASFSNRGRTTVSLGAPGVDILSLRGAGTDTYGDGLHFVPDGDPDAEYYTASGTSMAAPHVTGVVALVKAHSPGRDWRAVKNLILAGGDPVAELETTTVTGRRLNAYGALTCSTGRVLSGSGMPPVFPLPAGTPVTFTVLNIACADPAGPVRATTSTGARFDLRDNGRAPDLAAGDGLYTGVFTPTAATESITFASGSKSVTLPNISFSRYVPEAHVGETYRYALQAFGTAPYRWSIGGGSLPAGLRLAGGTGVISGTPNTAGRSLLELRVVDALGRVAIGDVSVEVGDDDVRETLLAVDHGGWKVYPLDVAADADGNTVVVGYSIDPQTRDEDWVVNKYDPSGALLWSRFRVSNTSWWANHATGVDIDADGNIYVTGGYPYFHADSDYIVTKYDHDGNELWTTSYSEGWIEVPLAVAVDPFGDVVITGTSSKIDHDDVLTVKFDSSGNRVWATTFPAQQLDQGADIDTDAAGNIYVGGRHGYAFSTSDGSTSFAYSYLTLKYATNGDVLWSQFSEDLETRRIDVGRAIAVDAAGHSYVGGGLSGAIERRDPNGELVWREPLFFEDHEVEIFAIALDGYGNLVAGGQYFDPVVEQWLNVLFTVDTEGRTLWSRRIGGDNLRTALGLSVDSSNVIHVAVARDGRLVVTTFRTRLSLAATGLPGGVRGDGYQQALQATGGATPLTWRVSAGTLPAGLTLDPHTGVLSGVPTDGGTFTFTVTVTGSDGKSVSRQVTLPIAFVAIEPVTVTPVSIGEPWQLQLYGLGTATPLTWHIAGGALPPGLTLDSASGLIAGTPTAGGAFTITVEVADAEGHAATVTLTIVVVEPLAILTARLPDAVAGSSYSVQLEARGGIPPYSWFYWGNPVPGLEVDAATGVISGVPTTPGVYETGVFVMDSRAIWVTQQLTLVVN